MLDADTETAVPWVATGYVAGPSLQATVSGLAGARAGTASGAYGPSPDGPRVITPDIRPALD